MRIPFFRRKKSEKVGAAALWENASVDEPEAPEEAAPVQSVQSEPTPTEHKPGSEQRKTRKTRIANEKVRRRKEANAKALEIFQSHKKPESQYGDRTVKVLMKPVRERFEDYHTILEDVVKCDEDSYNSLVVYGTAGIGKTHAVKEALAKAGLKEGKDWILLTSKCTPPALYQTALRFRQKGKIIVLDDVNFESGKTGQHMWELVKAMTDNYPLRTVTDTKASSNTKLVSSAEEAEEFLKSQKDEAKPKIPSMFGYAGSLIVITNLSESFFDPAFLSRSVTVPLFLTESEKIEHMRNILREIEPNMDIFLKEEVLNALQEQHLEDKELNKLAGTENLTRTQFDLRTLQLALKMAKSRSDWKKRLHFL